MTPRQAGYYGRPFQAYRGVRVGDTISPMIFNVVTDAILRQWQYEFNPSPLEEVALFYIDDGALTGVDATRLQEGLSIIERGFESFGLVMNASKTKFMTMTGGKHRLALSPDAYRHRVTGQGASYKELMAAKAELS